MVKASVLRKKTEEQLNKDLEEFRKNLSELRFNKVSASHQMKVSKLRTVRKDIARVLTTINTMKKDAAREKYAKAKYMPLDLRAKKTRKLRRKMTKHQRGLTTLKERKRAENYPQRTFALMQ